MVNGSHNPQTEAELVKLRLENQLLAKQVKRLVRTERRMIESQDKLDQQVHIYRQLNEVGKQFSRTFSIAEILRYTIQFIIYELNFERCLVLRFAPETQQCQPEMWDGYHGEDEVERLTHLVFSFQEPVFAPLKNAETEYLCCSLDSDDSALRGLGARMEMDEFFVFATGTNAHPEFLIAIGNTGKRAKYHCRIQDESSLAGLVNLISQAAAAISQANLYAQVHARAEELQQTLQELQRAQAQLIQSEKMSSLGQLVAGVAHEINNPVNFIYGNIKYATEYTRDLLNLIHLYQKHYPDPHPDIQAEADEIDFDFLIKDLPNLLSSMIVGADRIKEIIASLRIFSRMDEAEYKAVNLHDGIDSTLMILQNRLKPRHDRLEIKVIKEYGNLPLVECYAGQLNQVFMNILSNAIDALEETLETAADSLPTPQIKICTEMMDSHWVTIRIADNGTGISDKVQQRLFNPFFTTKAVGKGTGMGLSISYQIITERHGGTLQCISSPNQGAAFVITIPLKQNS